MFLPKQRKQKTKVKSKYDVLRHYFDRFEERSIARDLWLKLMVLAGEDPFFNTFSGSSHFSLCSNIPEIELPCSLVGQSGVDIKPQLTINVYSTTEIVVNFDFSFVCKDKSGILMGGGEILEPMRKSFIHVFSKLNLHLFLDDLDKCVSEVAGWIWRTLEITSNLISEDLIVSDLVSSSVAYIPTKDCDNFIQYCNERSSGVGSFLVVLRPNERAKMMNVHFKTRAPRLVTISVDWRANGSTYIRESQTLPNITFLPLDEEEAYNALAFFCHPSGKYIEGLPLGPECQKRLDDIVASFTLGHCLLCRK